MACIFVRRFRCSSLLNRRYLKDECCECCLCFSWTPYRRSQWPVLGREIASSCFMYAMETTFMLASFFSSPLICLRYFSTLYLSSSLDYGTIPCIFFNRGLGSKPRVKAPVTKNSSWYRTSIVVG